MGIILLLLIIGFLIFLRKKMRAWKTNVKGKISEHLVYHKMLQLSDEYTIFNDLLFESNGYSTQIDHLVVSPYGVFVIETKGYKGWIFGLSCYFWGFTFCYAYNLATLNKKNFMSVTPLKSALNAFNLALKDSAAALVCLPTKKLRILS